MKGQSTEAPSAVVRERNGRVVVRYNIATETIANEDGGEQTIYTYDEVVTHEPVSANKILKAVLAEEYGEDYELKLVNEWNAVQLGLSEDEDGAKEAKYKAYLTARAALKTEIDATCAANGIS